MKTSEIAREVGFVQNDEGDYVSGRIKITKVGVNYWVIVEGNPVRKMCLTSREAFCYAAAVHYGMKKKEMELEYGFSRFIQRP